tara:strand:- start:134 stop:553 length:420 start_codon:yes stop_codon:yes gene_type:complete
MYVYKVLVNCLPRSNQLKLVSLINQSSEKFIDTHMLNAYDYGIICQANASYVGVILVREQDNDSHVDHFCVLPSQRRKGYGQALFQSFVTEMKSNSTASIQTREAMPEWKIDLFDRWGWEKTKETDSGHCVYTLLQGKH